jgi:hypothetical protein
MAKLLAVAALAFAGLAQAQQPYPSRPIKLTSADAERRARVVREAGIKPD